jgi:hypothetical protein
MMKKKCENNYDWKGKEGRLNQRIRRKEKNNF